MPSNSAIDQENSSTQRTIKNGLKVKLTVICLATLLGGCAQSNPLEITPEERTQAEESCSFKLGTTEKHVLQPCLKDHAERLQGIKVKDHEAERNENEKLREKVIEVIGGVASKAIPAFAPLFSPRSDPVITTGETNVVYSE